MSNPNAPDTIDVLNSIVTYLLNAKLNDNVTPVYAPLTNALSQSIQPVQGGRFKDIGDYLPDGSTNAIGEVFPGDDDSERYGFGGATRDNQTFLIVSIVNISNYQTAVNQIIAVRDAIIPLFVDHVTLGATGNIIFAQLKRNSGKWLPVYRGGKEYLGYACELSVTSQWQAPVGFIA